MQREMPSDAAANAVRASRIRMNRAMDAIMKYRDILLIRIVYITSEDYM